MTSSRSRAEYDGRMHRVLAHIDKQLDQPLDLETLAEVAHFSRFHFHRLFLAWMGETLGDCGETPSARPAGCAVGGIWVGGGLRTRVQGQIRLLANSVAPTAIGAALGEKQSWSGGAQYRSDKSANLGQE